MSGYTIRLALAGDADGVAELWHSCYFDQGGTEKLEPSFCEERRNLAAFKLRVQAMVDAGQIWVAVDADGAPGGFTQWIGPGKENERRGEIGQFFLEPRARGTGLAKELLETAEHQLVAEGSEVAFLFCLPGNHRAERFYAFHGFVDHGQVEHSVDLTRGRRAPLTLTLFEKVLKGKKRKAADVDEAVGAEEDEGLPPVSCIANQLVTAEAPAPSDPLHSPAQRTSQLHVQQVGSSVEGPAQS